MSKQISTLIRKPAILGMTIILIAFSIISYSAHAEAFPSVIHNYSSPLKSKARLRNAGLVSLGAGVIVLSSGIFLGIKTGGFYYEYSNYNGYVYETGTPLNGLAGIMVLLGSAATITGTTLTIIGQKQVHKRKVTFDLKLTPGNLNLCYKF